MTMKRVVSPEIELISPTAQFYEIDRASFSSNNLCKSILTFYLDSKKE